MQRIIKNRKALALARMSLWELPPKSCFNCSPCVAKPGNPRWSSHPLRTSSFAVVQTCNIMAQKYANKKRKRSNRSPVCSEIFIHALLTHSTRSSKVLPRKCTNAIRQDTLNTPKVVDDSGSVPMKFIEYQGCHRQLRIGALYTPVISRYPREDPHEAKLGNQSRYKGPLLWDKTSM